MVSAVAKQREHWWARGGVFLMARKRQHSKDLSFWVTTKETIGDDLSCHLFTIAVNAFSRFNMDDCLHLQDDCLDQLLLPHQNLIVGAELNSEYYHKRNIYCYQVWFGNCV